MGPSLAVPTVPLFLSRRVFLLAWFIPAIVLLGIGKVLVRGIPFRRVAPMLGSLCELAPYTPLLTVRQQRQAKLIALVIKKAAGYTPWVSDCFPQASAACALLAVHRIPYVLYFGVRRGAQEGGMQAHAWVLSGRIPVTGGFSFSAYTVVGMFSRGASAGLAS